MLANAILERSVNEVDIIYTDYQNQFSYQTLKSLGILNLEPADIARTTFYIHLPYLWVWLLIKNASSQSVYKFWKLLIDPKQQFCWQQWENFNIGFLALRICL